MTTGAITEYIDVAQIVLYVFWAFFAGLIYYLQRESKREGYPMHSDRSGSGLVPGLLPMPSPKTFRMDSGHVYFAPHDRDNERQPLAAEPFGNYPGAPYEPTGNPMLDNVGPGSWTARADEPDITPHGEPRLMPLRMLADFSVARQDRNPIGMTVKGADDEIGGTVTDIWVDRSEMMVRYLELTASGEGARTVLLPANFCRIGREEVKVESILGHQFAYVPGIRAADRITLLEEEKVMAYYGGGTLYAEPHRREPML